MKCCASTARQSKEMETEIEQNFKVPSSLLKVKSKVSLQASLARAAKIKAMRRLETNEEESALLPNESVVDDAKAIIRTDSLGFEPELPNERRRLTEQALRQKPKLSNRDKQRAFFIQKINAFNAQYMDSKSLSRRPNSNEKLAPIEPKIKVCVRKRPLNSAELENQDFDVLSLKTDQYPNGICFMHEPKVKFDLTPDMQSHRFLFDNVYDEACSNDQIATDVVDPLVLNFLNGGKSTLFAFGATGSGKTHTMFGSSDEAGLIIHAAHQIMSNRSANQDVSVTFVEVYQGKIYDLFAKRSVVRLLDDEKGYATLQGHTEVIADDFSMLEDLISLGTEMRTVGSTEANATSSRSHAIFELTITNRDGSSKGKLALVDLAGSERGVDTGNIDKKAKREGSEINRSLLALKECIRALYLKRTKSEQVTHVPFRDSKLTILLRDSFIGKKSQTSIIAAVSPASSSVENTLNTLRYANRVKEFKEIDPTMNAISHSTLEAPNLRMQLMKKPSLPQISTLKDEELEQLKETGGGFDRNKDQSQIISHLLREHEACILSLRKISAQENIMMKRQYYSSREYAQEALNLVDEKMALLSDLMLKLQKYQD